MEVAAKSVHIINQFSGSVKKNLIFNPTFKDMPAIKIILF